jgi:SAM-dependent methyltransferase
MIDSRTAMPAIKLGSKKTDFSDTYDRPTPETYYRTLRGLDYKIPELARPFIKRCLDVVRKTLRSRQVRVIDLCCGYGVNAALLNHDVDMDDLYDRYTDWPGPDLLPQTMIEEDRRLFATRRKSPPVAEVIGVDVAANALTYARETGLLVKALPLNLERDNPDARTRALFSGADVVTVTGGLSYIGQATFERVLDCFPANRRPWVVWFPLRHVNVDSLTDTLTRFGLKTQRMATLPQRRMTDAGERQLVLHQLNEAGLDPNDEKAGYLHAVCTISRPDPSLRRVPC